MDDLSSKLSEILNSEQGMASLQSLANMLTKQADGNGSGSAKKDAPASDLSAALSGLLANQNGNQNSSLPAPTASGGGAPGGLDMSMLSGLLSGLTQKPAAANAPAQAQPDLANIDINMIMGIQQALSMMRQDNADTRMLKALRPLLRVETQHKLDKAIRMMQLFSILPMLTKSGLFQNLLG